MLVLLINDQPLPYNKGRNKESGDQPEIYVVEKVDQQRVVCHFTAAQQIKEKLDNQWHNGGKQPGDENTPKQVDKIDAFCFSYPEFIKCKNRYKKNIKKQSRYFRMYARHNIIDGPKQNDQVNYQQWNPAYNAQGNTKPDYILIWNHEKIPV